MFGWFKRKPETETRSSGTNYTAQIVAARSDYIAGTSGLAELTSTVQSSVSLWESGLSVADVDGTDLLTKRALALAGRALALRGEAVFVIEENGLLPSSDWDMTTRFSKPTAYRVGIPGAGGGTTRTVLAAEVLHFRTGADMNMPYLGQSPLRRSGLTAGLLHHGESALSEVYRDGPIGSSVVPFPESPDTDMGAIARAFRGYRGKVQVRDSVNVTAAGGPAPQTDWKPQNVSPDIQGAMPKEALDAARSSVLMAFGVLPGLASAATTGPLVREAQRHLAQWALQPLAEGIAEECADKLGTVVTLDVMRPLQAFDAGGRARAMTGVIQALAMAKEAGVDPAAALKLVDWDG